MKAWMPVIGQRRTMQGKDYPDDEAVEAAASAATATAPAPVAPTAPLAAAATANGKSAAMKLQLRATLKKAAFGRNRPWRTVPFSMVDDTVRKRVNAIGRSQQVKKNCMQRMMAEFSNTGVLWTNTSDQDIKEVAKMLQRRRVALGRWQTVSSWLTSWAYELEQERPMARQLKEHVNLAAVVLNSGRTSEVRASLLAPFKVPFWYTPPPPWAERKRKRKQGGS